MHHISRTDVSFDKLEAAVSSYAFQISQIGTVVKLVHNNDLEGMGRNNQSIVSETKFERSEQERAPRNQATRVCKHHVR
jgi:hypothetical protein